MHRTRNMASDTDFKFIMETILGQKEDSPLSKAFERDAITDIGDIMCIPDRYIDQLKFPDDTSGKIVLIELGQGYRALIHCFQAFVLMKNAEGKPVQGDFQNLVDKAEFQEFGIASFGIDVIPNEPPGLSSHLYTLTDNTVLVLEVDDRIDSIPSKSPRLDGIFVCRLRLMIWMSIESMSSLTIRFQASLLALMDSPLTVRFVSLLTIVLSTLTTKVELM